MSIIIFYHTLYYFLIPISTIGYGLTLLYLGNNKKIEYNFGYSGLFGIFFLIAYSYLTHIFFPHGKIHNLILIIIGLFFFILFFITKIKKSKKKILLFLIAFITLYIGSFIFKTHDDFPYYHFSYSYHLTQNEIIAGIGKFNHGYRTPSSIFYLNSLFYLPGVSFYLFHIPAIMIMGFTNIILLSKIIKSIQLKKITFLSYYCLLAFMFINIFFYRIGEHGTDRSAQILIFLLIMEIIIFLNYKLSYKVSISLILMLMAIITSLKAFYILYFIFFIPIFIGILKKNNFKKSFLLLTYNIYFIFFSIIIFFIFFNSLVNTGCLLYPIKITCINSLEWGIPLGEVQLMNDWYEQWSKGGAAPNFRVDNPQKYIQFFNWVPNWINIYFFNKVSDFILGLILLVTIVVFTFKGNIFKKNKKKKNNYIYLIYLILIILGFEWFYNHPALRYGGYCIIALLFFIPICLKLELNEINYKKYTKNVFILCIIAISIFNLRNFHRIAKEVNFYKYEPINETFYFVADNSFRIQEKMDKFRTQYDKCMNLEYSCNLEKQKIYSKYGKKIFNNRK